MNDLPARLRIGALVWLPMVAAITVLAGLVYVAVQQNLRMSANDPQIQMAQDAAAALARGQTVSTVLPPQVIDLSHSLAPYLIVFDDAGQIVASSAQISGKTPALPPGVLTYTRKHGETRITWQPEPAARGAVVVVRYEGANPGFVLAGRSLREVERRIDTIGLLVGLAWMAALGAALVTAFLVAAVGGGSGPLAAWARERSEVPQYRAREV